VHHYHFFLGPVNDILHGKFLMVNTESQYGILLTLFLTVIFKYLLPLSYANLYLVVMAVTIVYYLFLYIFLRKIHHSRIFTSLALLSIFAAHILALNTYNPPHETYAYPSVTPLRFIFDIPIFLLLLHFITTQKYKFLYLASALAGVAVFYNFEIGISCAITVFAFIGITFIFSVSPFAARLKHACMAGIIMLITMLVVGSMVSLLAHTITGQWPEWMQLLYHARIHGTGFMAMPLPKGPHYYYFVLTVYAAILLAAVIQKFYKIVHPLTHLFAAMAIYGLLIFHYYLNRSHTNNLFVIIVPAMILLSMILKFAWQRTQQSWQNKHSNPSLVFYTTLIAGVVGIYILLGAYQMQTFAKIATQRYSPLFSPHESFVWDYQGTGFYEPYIDPMPFEEAASALSAYADKNGRVALLSGYDTLLCIMSDTVNIINYFNIENEPNVRQQLENTTEQLMADKPEMLFIDTSRTITNNIDEIFNAVKTDRYRSYQTVTVGGTLELDWPQRF